MSDLNVELGEAASRNLGNASSFFKQDVTDESSWDELEDYIETNYGGLDILVNNAGILATETTQNIETTSLAQWRAVQQVNVEGVFMGCRMAVRIMKDAGGSIVNISSTAGIVGAPMLVAYGASKGAVRLLTKGVALHCAQQRYHIRCNSVHPGPIETDMGDALLGLQNFIDGPNLESKWETMRRSIPTGNTGVASDIASCILFLASDDSIHMTGSELVVDGGMTAN
jgi:NAD(P)-dependent dehydrogenase (short-subunit alcohol dehydrogenase family)